MTAGITKGDESGVYLVESSKKDGTTYRVDIETNICACAGFVFRKRCRHLELAKSISGTDEQKKEKILTEQEEKWLNDLKDDEEFSGEIAEAVFGDDRIKDLLMLGEIWECRLGFYRRLK